MASNAALKSCSQKTRHDKGESKLIQGPVTQARVDTTQEHSTTEHEAVSVGMKDKEETISEKLDEEVQGLPRDLRTSTSLG